MRIILAGASLVIAAVLFWYSVTVALLLNDEVGFAEIDPSNGEMRVALVIIGGSFILGFVLLLAGIAVLTTKPRHKQ